MVCWDLCEIMGVLASILGGTLDKQARRLSCPMVPSLILILSSDPSQNQI
jgi:hypothetical protein